MHRRKKICRDLALQILCVNRFFIFCMRWRKRCSLVLNREENRKHGALIYSTAGLDITTMIF